MGCKVPIVVNPDTHIWVYADEPPKWLGVLATSIALGGGQPESVNGSTIDIKGNLVLYRKLSKEDHDRFPALDGVEEIWLTYEMRWGE